MKFDPVKWPRCGKLAMGTLETLPGLAVLDIDPDTGEAQYGGWTDIWWDAQKSVHDSNGRCLLACKNAHEWTAEGQE
jgi:hypothetical protein